MNGLRTGVVVVAAMTLCGLAAGCGDSADPADPRAGDGTSGGTSGTSDASGPGTGGDSGAGGSADGGSTGAVPPSCNGDEGGPVPTTPVAMQAWLITRKYTCWTKESAKHSSTGPHGGDVRTYLNGALDASMKGAAEHPAGSVAVKELYGSSSEVTGWAVGVKTQAASAGGQGWYWYEAFGTQPGASTIEGQNKALCTNCHAAGKDYVLIPYPLR